MKPFSKPFWLGVMALCAGGPLLRAGRCAPAASSASVPVKGEVRLDGRVRAITGPSSFSLSASSFTAPSGNTREFEEARPKTVIVVAKAQTESHGYARPFATGDVKLGERVAVIGTLAGAALRARHVILLPSTRTTWSGGVRTNRATSLLLKEARKAREADRFGRAEELYRAAAAKARELNDAPGEYLSWHNLGRMLSRLERRAEAVEPMQLAMRAAERMNDPVELADSVHGLSDALWFAKRHAEALPIAERALRLHREQGSVEKQIEALTDMASMNSTLNRPEQALALMEQAVALRRKAGPSQSLLGELRDLADLYGSVPVSGPEAEIRALREAASIAKTLDTPEQEFNISTQLAYKLCHTDIAEARACAAHAETLAARTPSAELRARQLGELGSVHDWLRDHAKAHTAWEKAATEYRALNKNEEAARLEEMLRRSRNAKPFQDADNANN